MASLLNTLFRRNRSGDPVWRVADTAALNFVYSVLEDLQGVGCRIEKPTSDGGAGWRIVFDGFKTTDIKPPEKMSFKRTRGDAEIPRTGRVWNKPGIDGASLALSESIDYGQLDYPNSGYRLLNFGTDYTASVHQDYDSGHGLGNNPSSFARYSVLAWNSGTNSGNSPCPSLGYLDISGALSALVCFDGNTMRRNRYSTCAPWQIRLDGFATRATTNIDEDAGDFLILREICSVSTLLYAPISGVQTLVQGDLRSATYSAVEEYLAGVDISGKIEDAFSMPPVPSEGEFAGAYTPSSGRWQWLPAPDSGGLGLSGAASAYESATTRMVEQLSSLEEFEDNLSAASAFVCAHLEEAQNLTVRASLLALSASAISSQVSGLYNQADNYWDIIFGEWGKVFDLQDRLSALEGRING